MNLYLDLLDCINSRDNVFLAKGRQQGVSTTLRKIRESLKEDQKETMIFYHTWNIARRFDGYSINSLDKCLVSQRPSLIIVDEFLFASPRHTTLKEIASILEYYDCPKIITMTTCEPGVLGSTYNQWSKYWEIWSSRFPNYIPMDITDVP